jgi:hypothetical protein
LGTGIVPTTRFVAVSTTATALSLKSPTYSFGPAGAGLAHAVSAISNARVSAAIVDQRAM